MENQQQDATLPPAPGLDRARPLEFVKQYVPRGTFEHVEYHDHVYDRQVALNETAAHYFGADQQGEAAAMPVAERAKWVTESWPEYEDRCVQREAALKAYFDGVREEESQKQAERDSRATVSANTVSKLMQREEDRLSRKLQPRHTLYVDFEAEKLKKMAVERASMEEEELEARAEAARAEQEARNAFEQAAAESMNCVLVILEERERLRREEEERIRQEQQRKADALRAAEEEKKRQLEAEERAKKEAEEEARRAERRRKDEERKNKARAEREARARLARGGGPAAAPTTHETQTPQQKLSASLTNYYNAETTKTVMANFLQQLQQKVEQVNAMAALGSSSTEAMDSAAHIMTELVKELCNGRILTHTAVTVAVASVAEATLSYIFSSPNNGSTAVRSGGITRSVTDNVVGEKCFGGKVCTGVLPFNTQNRSGATPLDTSNEAAVQESSGYFAAFPIFATFGNASEERVVQYVLTADTLSCNLADGEKRDEALASALYDAHKKLHANVVVPIPSPVETFLQSICDILSHLSFPPVAAQQTSAPKLRSIHEGGTPKSMSGALCKASSIIREATACDVYISRVQKKNCAATIVVQNGISVGDPVGRAEHGDKCPLLGSSLTSTQKEAISFGSTKLHDKDAITKTSTELFALRAELVPNVIINEQCFKYGGDSAKKTETLLLVPADKNCRYLIGASKDGENSMSMDHILSICQFVLNDVWPVLADLNRMQMITSTARQALSWLEITSGAPNCYVALRQSMLVAGAPEDVLQYISASDSQRFIIGKTVSLTEETQSQRGISFEVMKNAVQQPAPAVLNVDSVSAFNQRPTEEHHELVGGNKIRMLGTSSGEGDALLACPIAYQGKAYGMLFADTVGSVEPQKNKKECFGKGDEDIIRSTAQLLGEILLGGKAASTEGIRLSIERDLGIDATQGGGCAAADDGDVNPIHFLKCVYAKCTADIQAITNNQLLELSKYNSPPPIIPITVAATLIIALGSKPKLVESWENARKKVKQSLLDKIATFDPTNPQKRKKPFFLRARKMTTGYTAVDVYIKGSYPASCFFTWTFITILLRKSSDKLRKVMSSAAVGTSTGSALPVEFLLEEGHDDDASVATDDTAATDLEDLGGEEEEEEEDDPTPQ